MNRFTVGTKFSIEWLGFRAGVIETWTIIAGQTNPAKFQISDKSPLVLAISKGDDSYISGSLRLYFRILEIMDSAGEPIDFDATARKFPSDQSNSTNTGIPSDIVRDHLSALLQAALSDDFRHKTSISLPLLNEKDIQLSLKWLGSLPPLSKEELITQHGEDYELARMLSARAAEKAVIRFFERMLTDEVQDVSLTQLFNLSSQGNWKKYDIIANGIAYDVKNSRETRLNATSYVEHCVPKYKEYRDQNVKIVGALSPYLRVRELLKPETISVHHQTAVRVLGYVDEPTVDKLTRYFETDTFKLEFRRYQQNGKFLPPWIFDYPVSYYSKRDSGLRRIVETINIDEWPQAHLSPVPVYLALGLKLPVEWQKNILYTWQVDFIQRLVDSHNEFGLSLPAIFLTILTHFLKMASVKSHAFENYDPSQYRKLLFNVGSSTNPLFLHDPLETVDSLIETLTILWNAKTNRIQEYSSFRLVSAGILRGRLASNPNIEHSLVAYCGGRTKENWPCGNVPLVLGKHQHCKSCGMLICDKCGFCSKQCPKNAERQSKFLPRQQSVARQYAGLDYEDDMSF